jgi:hypothetical protein
MNFTEQKVLIVKLLVSKCKTLKKTKNCKCSKNRVQILILILVVFIRISDN